MNYYISDPHIGCRNKYENRTLDHDKLLKENWNCVVTNADTVYVLGDIGKEGGNRDVEYLCELISTLKGKKILVQGNHEKLKDLRLKQLFTEICQYKEVTDNFNGINTNVVLSHYPILIWNGQHNGWVHLYGHVHMTDEWGIYMDALQGLNDYFAERTRQGATDCPQVRAYNVGAMLPYMDYTPRSLKEILLAHDDLLLPANGKNSISTL